MSRYQSADDEKAGIGNVVLEMKLKAGKKLSWV